MNDRSVKHNYNHVDMCVYVGALFLCALRTPRARDVPNLLALEIRDGDIIRRRHGGTINPRSV